MIRFHNFEIDTESRELFDRGQRVIIQKKVFELLIYLIENRDRAVSKNELLDKLWENKVVTEGVLAHATTKLRSALNDKGKNGSIIRTVHGFGLQFVAHIFEESTQQPQPESEAEPDSDPNQAVPIKSLPPNPIGLKILAPLLIIAGAIFWMLTQNGANTEIESNPNSNETIAIMSNQASGDWKTDGMIHLLNQVLLYSGLSNSISALDKDYLLSESKLPLSGKSSVTVQDGLVYLNLNGQSIQIERDELISQLQNTIQWTCQELDQSHNKCDEAAELLQGISDLALENYFRGVEALKLLEPVKAINHFKITLSEHPNFEMARIALAEALYSTSKYLDAQSELESIIQTTDNETIRLHALMLLGKVHFSLSDFTSAEVALNQVIQSETKSQGILNSALLELAEVKRHTNQFDEAIELASKALLYFEQVDNEYIQSKAHEHLGSVYLTMGQLSEAKNHFFISLRLAEKYELYETISKNLSSLSLIHQREGNYQLSLEYSLQRLKLIENKGDASELISAHIGLTYIYLDMGKHALAEEHANAMWKLIEQSNEPDSLFLGYYILGELASFQGQYALSVSRMEHALRIAETQQTNWRIAQVNCALAGFAIHANVLDEAMQFANECKNVSETNQLKLFSAVAVLHQGTINAKLKNFTAAKEQLNQALQVGIELDHDQLKYQAYVELIYLELDSTFENLDHYIGSIPAGYHRDFEYIYISGLIAASKQQFNEALSLLSKAKSVAGDNWTEENELNLKKVRDSL